MPSPIFTPPTGATEFAPTVRILGATKDKPAQFDVSLRRDSTWRPETPNKAQGREDSLSIEITRAVVELAFSGRPERLAVVDASLTVPGYSWAICLRSIGMDETPAMLRAKPDGSSVTAPTLTVGQRRSVAACVGISRSDLDTFKALRVRLEPVLGMLGVSAFPGQLPEIKAKDRERAVGSLDLTYMLAGADLWIAQPAS